MDESRVAVVVEDDEDIRVAVCALLRESGFTVHAAATGAKGVAAVQQFEPDIMTLDIGLPDIDGFEVSRRVRRFSDTCIVFLTARNEELDILLGLESGADDYLTKPFRPRELRARVSALMRRRRSASIRAPLAHPETPRSSLPAPAAVQAALSAAPAPPVQPVMQAVVLAARHTGTRQEATPAVSAPLTPGVVLELNGLILQAATRTATARDSEVDLTRTEFELLCALMEAGRVVLTKADLARRLRFREYDTGAFVSMADERTVEVHVGNLRRKLGDNPKLPRWVETVRGIGYRMAPRHDACHESSLSR